MQSKENAMFKQLMEWKLSDLIDSYEINMDSEIEKALRELVMCIIKDIKENDCYDDKNN